MRKAACFVVCLCVIGVFAGCSWGAEVPIDEEHFPDASFRAYIFNTFDLNGDGVLSDEEIDNAELLTLNKDLGYYDEIHYVASLKGIEYLTALTYLNCDNNGLRDLDVSRNAVLAYLYCSGNRLTDLNLSNNSTLKGLYCNGNLLSSLSMGGCHELKDLFCDYNQLSSLGISSNSALERLKCSFNKLPVLDVSDNKALCYLEAYSFMEDAFARFYVNPQQAKIDDIDASLNISGLRLLQNGEGDYYVNLNDYVPNATAGIRSVQVWRLRRFYLNESSQGVVYIARKNGDPYDDYTGSWWNYIKSNLDNGDGVVVNFSHSLTPNADGENDKLGGCYISLFTGSYNEPTTNAPTPPASLDLKVEAIGGGLGTDKIICGFDSEHYFDSNGNALTEESIADYSYENNGKLGLVADGNSRLIIRVQSDRPGRAMFVLDKDSGLKLERLTDRTSIQYKETLDAVKIRDGLYQVSAVVVAPEGFPKDKNFPSDTFNIIVSFTGEDQEIQKGKNYKWYNLPPPSSM